jgi:hypothetical protein
MKRVKAMLWLVGALSIPAAATAQVDAAGAEEADQGSPFSASITLNQDAFFGFYPILGAGYEVADGIDFTFYSIIWTTPSFGVGAPSGFGLWTEVGLGASFRLLDDSVSITPQLGLLNGALLNGTGEGLAGEGIVPNLTADYDGKYAEGEFYFGYYIALRGESDTKSNFIHYWAYAGLKPLALLGGAAEGLLSVGAHWEQLRYQRVPADGDAFNLYRWIGPYVALALPNDISLRFGIGWNLDKNDAATVPIDFYKASIGMSF